MKQSVLNADRDPYKLKTYPCTHRHDDWDNAQMPHQTYPARSYNQRYPLHVERPQDNFLTKVLMDSP